MLVATINLVNGNAVLALFMTALAALVFGANVGLFVAYQQRRSFDDPWFSAMSKNLSQGYAPFDPFGYGEFEIRRIRDLEIGRRNVDLYLAKNYGGSPFDSEQLSYLKASLHYSRWERLVKCVAMEMPREEIAALIVTWMASDKENADRWAGMTESGGQQKASAVDQQENPGAVNPALSAAGTA